MQNKSLALKVGTQLQNGRYTISRILGQGGFGITYEATLANLKKRVAVKEYFLNGVCGRGEDEKAVIVPLENNREIYERQRLKFHNEADRLANLSNPHLVSVHDLFEENGTSYYVMDFIKGDSLSKIIEQSPTPLAEKDVMYILDQMLDALQCIHSEAPPLCHLDIKPANIMIDDKGHAVLIDFGASKYATTGEGSVSLSSVIYTPSFAPVEQLSGNRKSMGPWTDFYALGATLYAMLTLKKPAEPSDILVDKTQEKAHALPFPPSVSPRLRQLILWMMAFDKSDRPHSVDEIRRWLGSGASASTLGGAKMENGNTMGKGNNMVDESTIIDTNERFDEKTERTSYNEHHSASNNSYTGNRRDEDARQSYYDDDDESSSNKPKILLFALLAAALLAGGYWLFSSKEPDTPAKTEEVAKDKVEQQHDTPLEQESKDEATGELPTTDNGQEVKDANVKEADKQKQQDMLDKDVAVKDKATDKGRDDMAKPTKSNQVEAKPESPAPQKAVENKIYDVVDQPPTFAHGNVMAWLSQNIHYPSEAEANGIHGKVLVSFVVEKDGSIVDVKVVKSVDPSLDNEAVRAVRSMPRWNPGKQNGQAVRVKYNLPITFKL